MGWVRIKRTFIKVLRLQPALDVNLYVKYIRRLKPARYLVLRERKYKKENRMRRKMFRFGTWNGSVTVLVLIWFGLVTVSDWFF